MDTFMPKVIILLGHSLGDIPIHKYPQPLTFLPEAGRHATDTLMEVCRLIRITPEISSGTLQPRELYIITHSVALVNFMGLVTEDGFFKPGDVVVKLHVNQEVTGEYTFNKEGIIADGWPFGWFLADSDKALRFLKGLPELK